MFRTILRYEHADDGPDITSDLSRCLAGCGFPDGLVSVHRLWGDCALVLRDRSGARRSPVVPGILLEQQAEELRLPPGHRIHLISLGEADCPAELLVKAWPDCVTPDNIGVEPWERFFTRIEMRSS